MKSLFAKRNSRIVAVLLTVAMLLVSFAWAMPVSAEDQADMQKANVKWDLKNNKTLKVKTTWSVLGTKTHTVRMTKFKVKKAKQPGYKQCTFTLTFKKDIKPKKNQIIEMADLYSEAGEFGGRFYFAVADYKTGESLEVPNDKGVTVKSKWSYSKYTKKKAKGGVWIKFPKVTTVKVTITYPNTYKDLAIGVGGYTCTAEYVEVDDEGTYEADAPYTRMFFLGGDLFSDADYLYSKTDKSFAHFMRVTA